jgi:putative ABC transport system substrate-binding protein
VLLAACDRLPGASPQARIPRVGVLLAYLAQPRNDTVGAIKQGLTDLGYVEGQNIVMEWRFTHDGPGGTFADLAAELVALPVQVIVAITTPAVVAAAQVTRTVPIVTGFSRDLVELGLAQSYARPGGNVTGTGSNSRASTKLVELLKETVPTLSRVAYLFNPTTPGTAPQMAQVQDVAHALGLDFIQLAATTGDDIEPALQSAVVAHADGLVVATDVVFNDPRATSLPQQYGLPAIYSSTVGYVDHGGLMGYSQDVVASIRRSATYVDKILKGASPAELPIEDAMSFDLGINLTTARALGLTIPDDVLLQATQIFQ